MLTMSGGLPAREDPIETSNERGEALASNELSFGRGVILCAAVCGLSGFAHAAPTEYQPVGITPLMEENSGPGSPVCEADFNGDGAINFFDMIDFINAYLAQDPAADIMPPFGVWNFLDIQMFITRLRVGCPTP
jgi:hypothetical protein